MTACCVTCFGDKYIGCEIKSGSGLGTRLWVAGDLTCCQWLVYNMLQHGFKCCCDLWGRRLFWRKIEERRVRYHGCWWRWIEGRRVRYHGCWLKMDWREEGEVPWLLVEMDCNYSLRHTYSFCVTKSSYPWYACSWVWGPWWYDQPRSSFMSGDRNRQHSPIYILLDVFVGQAIHAGSDLAN